MDFTWLTHVDTYNVVLVICSWAWCTEGKWHKSVQDSGQFPGFFCQDAQTQGQPSGSELQKEARVQVLVNGIVNESQGSSFELIWIDLLAEFDAAMSCVMHDHFLDQGSGSFWMSVCWFPPCFSWAIRSQDDPSQEQRKSEPQETRVRVPLKAHVTHCKYGKLLYMELRILHQMVSIIRDVVRDDF